MYLLRFGCWGNTLAWAHWQSQYQGAVTRFQWQIMKKNVTLGWLVTETYQRQRQNTRTRRDDLYRENRGAWQIAKMLVVAMAQDAEMIIIDADIPQAALIGKIGLPADAENICWLSRLRFAQRSTGMTNNQISCSQRRGKRSRHVDGEARCSWQHNYNLP